MADNSALLTFRARKAGQLLPGGATGASQHPDSMAPTAASHGLSSRNRGGTRCLPCGFSPRRPDMEPRSGARIRHMLTAVGA